MSRALIVGELILDTTVPIQVPTRARSLLRRSEPFVYDQREKGKTTLGGLFYIGRFLRHFSEVDLVFPLRRGGLYGERYSKLVREVRGRDFRIHAVDSEGECYNAARYLESADSVATARPDFLERRGMLRIDSGTIGPLSERDSDRFLTRLRQVTRDWPPANRKACVVLADYDLGVFTRHVLSEVRGILPADVPLAIYGGRTWRQYATWKNATIVADTNEAIADLMLMEGIDDEPSVEQHPFQHVATRFPELRGLVLVDRKQTRVAEWEADTNRQKIHGETAILDLAKPYARTPIGHRALVAACLALARMKRLSLQDWPRVAHYAAEGSNDEILLGDIPQTRVNRVRDVFSHARFPAKVPRCEINPLRCSPGEILWSQVVQGGGHFPFDISRTSVPDIVTTHVSFRNDVNRVLEDVLNYRLPRAAVEDQKTVIQKLLVLGDSGAGKSFVARCIAQAITPDNVYVNCVDRNVPPAADGMAALIRKSVSDNGALVLDEFDKHSDGQKLHSLLLRFFDDDESRRRLSKWKHVVVVAACSRPINSLSRNDRSNHRDIYTRFPARLIVPPLSDRPLDAVHVCASLLRASGIRVASLAGLSAVANSSYGDLRSIRALALKLLKLGRNHRVDCEVFDKVGVAVGLLRRRDRDVLLEPLV